jgi:predicted short-subunit dehydrogenase-like oxidoreductase (DUF2520 family)
LLRILIIGPGRVGRAFAHRWSAAGYAMPWLCGRDAGRTAAVVASLPGAESRSLAAVAQAHVVVFAVGDPELPAVVAAAAAAAVPRRCSLWLHTSGRHGLEVFAPVATAGVRLGALHPVAPFAAADPHGAALQGAPAVLEGPPPSLRLLRRLAASLGLVPVELPPGADRVLYHAACALAANGATALRALVDRAFVASGLPAAAGARLGDALLQAAITGCREHGPVAALSGPVRRGDAETVRRHLGRLDRRAPEVAAAYRVLMQQALELACEGGLSIASAVAVAAALRPPAG